VVQSVMALWYCFADRYAMARLLVMATIASTTSLLGCFCDTGVNTSRASLYLAMDSGSCFAFSSSLPRSFSAFACCNKAAMLTGEEAALSCSSSLSVSSSIATLVNVSCATSPSSSSSSSSAIAILVGDCAAAASCPSPSSSSSSSSSTMVILVGA
jgi:hypothetical protein